MEKLSDYNVEYKTNEELIESIYKQLEQIKGLQRYTLNEQEQIKIQSMNTSELIKLLIENQTETSNKINDLIERLG